MKRRRSRSPAVALVLVLGSLGGTALAGTVDGKRTGHTGSPKPSGPIVITGKSDLDIRNLSISNPNGPCIFVRRSSNIRILNSRIGPCKDQAIRIDQVDGIAVIHNTIRQSAKGVYAHRSSGVLVARNDFTNTGRNLVQFDKVNGPGSKISRNLGVSTNGNPKTEDLISIYRSNGTSSSPIRIYYNRLKGGGRSRSGSGIMLGDEGGSHQIAAHNTLVEPGQTGIGVAGGQRIRVFRNRVVQGTLPWSNVGLYVWNQSDEPCSGVRVDHNQVSWLNKAGQPSSYWGGSGCGSVQELNNDFRAPLTKAIFHD